MIPFELVTSDILRMELVANTTTLAMIVIQKHSLEIHPIGHDDLDAVLDVYRQCEDFLALGPVPTASMEMVLKDIEISQNDGGIFCGIFAPDGKMIGIIDYVPSNYKGDPHVAFLELLMIAAPFRNRGIGKAVVEAIENEIRKDASEVSWPDNTSVALYGFHSFRIFQPDVDDRYLVHGTAGLVCRPETFRA